MHISNLAVFLGSFAENPSVMTKPISSLVECSTVFPKGLQTDIVKLSATIRTFFPTSVNLNSPSKHFLKQKTMKRWQVRVHEGVERNKRSIANKVPYTQRNLKRDHLLRIKANTSQPNTLDLI